MDNSNIPQSLPPATDNGKTIAILSYVTLLGFIAAVVMHSSNKTSFGAFHLRQALLLLILWMGSGIIMIIPLIGWLIGMVGMLTCFVLWIISFIGAVNGEEKKAPIIGDKAQEMFANAFN